MTRKFLPLAPQTALSALQQVFHDLRLPPPQHIEVLAAGNPYIARITDADGGQHRLLIAHGDDVPGGLYGALHAARTLEGDPDAPVLRRIVLPIGVFGVPAWLGPLPTGAPSSDPALLGAVLGALPPQAHFGAGATPHGPHPLTASWGGDYQALARRWLHQAQARGTCLQPLASTLLDAIDPDALDFAGPPVLVPGALEVWAEGGQVTAVEGWWRSWSGDPLSALGPWLHRDGPFVQALLAGQDPSLPRLRAYAAGHALATLASAGRAIGAYERVGLLLHAVHLGRALDSLAARVDGASVPAPDAALGPALACMDRLVRQPLPSLGRAWANVAASQLLALERPTHAPIAVRMLQHMEAGGSAAAPLPDDAGVDEGYAGVILRIGQALAQAVGAAPQGFAGALAALGRSVAPPGEQALARLRLALLCEGLEVRGPRLDEVWADFDYVAPGAELEALCARYDQPEALDGVSEPVPLLLYAATRPVRWSVPPHAALAALGLRA